MGEGVVVGVLDALIKDFTGKLARSDADAMAEVTMREIRAGEVPPDGGTALQEDPDRPVFRGNGPDDYVCVQCGNVLAQAMDAEHMTYKVRVRCGRCSHRQRRGRAAGRGPAQEEATGRVRRRRRRDAATRADRAARWRRRPWRRRRPGPRSGPPADGPWPARRGRSGRRGRRARAAARRTRSPWPAGRRRGGRCGGRARDTGRRTPRDRSRARRRRRSGAARPGGTR